MAASLNPPPGFSVVSSYSPIVLSRSAAAGDQLRDLIRVALPGNDEAGARELREAIDDRQRRSALAEYLGLSPYASIDEVGNCIHDSLKASGSDAARFFKGFDKPEEQKGKGMVSSTRETQRQSQIMAVRESLREFVRREEAAGRAILCSGRGYIDQILRGAGSAPLTDAEAAACGVTDENLGTREARRSAVESHGVSHADRRTLIALSRRAFEREQASGKRVICSEQAWVNQSLREMRQPLLAESETRELAIVAAG